MRGAAAACALAVVLTGLGVVDGSGTRAGVVRARPQPPSRMATTSTSTTLPAPTPTPLDRRLVIIGDSVILGARADLFARLGARGWAITAFAARESFFTWDAPAVVDWLRPLMGEVVVIQLGTNDGADPAQFAASIDQVMVRLQGVARVYWVNMRNFRSWVPAANAQIVAATTRFPNLRVIDWSARSTPDRSTVGSDGLHLPPYGSTVMAEVVAGALDGYFAERSVAGSAPSDPAGSMGKVAGLLTERAAPDRSGVTVTAGSGVAVLAAFLVAGAALLLVGVTVLLRDRRWRRSTLGADE